MTVWTCLKCGEQKTCSNNADVPSPDPCPVGNKHVWIKIQEDQKDIVIDCGCYPAPGASHQKNK